MTLMYPRGRALESIASWTTYQTLPRERIELIVVGNGSSPKLEETLRAKLSSRDHLLRVVSGNEMELYDFGARRAQAPWILFTEPHVIADANCLVALLQYLKDRRLDGACVRTLATTERQWVAQLEARMYLEDAASWTQEGDWRKFTKRGFMLRRTAYEAVGGLDWRYQRFAETAIATKLHAQGFRLGYAPEAVITHYNSTTLAELLEYVWEYRQQACAFAEDHPRLSAAGALPGCDRDLGDGCFDPRIAKAALRCIGSTFRAALRRCGTRSGRSLGWTMLRAGWLTWLGGLLGRRWHRQKVRLRYWIARLKLACLLQDNDTRQRAFMQVCERLGDYAAASYLLERRVHRSSAPAGLPEPVDGNCRPGELACERLWGFHAPEMWNGRRFRWTAPVACLAVDLFPGRWEVTLDTEGLRCPGFDDVRLFWNGAPATPALWRSGNGRLTFLVERSHFAVPGPQLLTLTCSRLRGCGQNERRALGLPLFAIEFHEANDGSMQAAA
jgi:hypothetical protein